MNRELPWIAPLVQQCLSFFLDGGKSKPIEVEDDGTNLNFRVKLDAKAKLASWAVGSSCDGVVLMDSDNQIDAKISHDAMAAFKLESSNMQRTGRGPEKHEIALLDFKIVLMYSTSSPDIRLEINSFRIDWDKGVQKFTPSKKLKKNKHVRLLLDRALQKVKNPEKAVEPNGARTALSQSSGFDIAHNHQPSDTQTNALDGMMSQQLSSQMHSNDSARPDRTSKSDNVALPASTELLQCLAPSVKANSRSNQHQSSISRQPIRFSRIYGTPQVIIHGNHDNKGRSRGTPLVDEVDDGHQRQGVERSLGREGNNNSEVWSSQMDREMAPRSQNLEAANKPTLQADAEMLASQQPPGLPENAVSRRNRSPFEHVEPNDEEIGRGSKKRQRESVESQPPSPGDGSKSEFAEEPSSKKRRTEAGPSRLTEHDGIEDSNLVKTQTARFQCQKSNPDADTGQGHQPMRADPWEGMESIPANEVTIPAEQAELLDDRTCWIPPAAGDPVPQGHVPPYLLKQWNTLAARRYRLAEEPKATPERSPSPIQDATMSPASDDEDQDDEDQDDEDQDDDESAESPASWSRSPERAHPRNALPPSSSPLKQSPPARTEPTPSPNKETPDDVSTASNTKTSNGTHQMPDSENTESGAAQPVPGGSAFEGTPSGKRSIPEADNYIRLSQNSVCDAERRDTDIPMQGEPAVTESQGLSSDRGSPAADVPMPHENLDDSRTNDNDSGDESDESMMEASVPVGLGENWTQSTQAEQELTSSRPSLSNGTAGAHVQVAVTPAINNSGPLCSKVNNDQSEVEPPQSVVSSSHANKTPSQSRILNTYPHHGGSEKSQSSHEGLNPSSTQSEEGSLRVDVLRTQTQGSSSIELSQGGTQSQEIVLDSSGAPQRHQNISPSQPQPAVKPSRQLFASPVAPTQSQANDPSQEPITDNLSQDAQASSLQVSLSWPRCAVTQSRKLFASPVAPTQSQASKPTQESTGDNLTQDVPASSPQISPTQHPETAVTDHWQEQGLHQSSPTNGEDETTSQAQLNAQNTPAMTCYVGRVHNKDNFAGANKAYETFCSHYPVYTGGFDHFTELCFKLQAVRAQGKLQRSLLWDDFVIMHLLRYPSHIKQRASQNSGILSYEDYFCLNFTYPRHEKRSLTAQAIDQAASQFAREDEASPVATSRASSKPHSTPHELEDHCFMASLLNGFTNFHAHSFLEIPQSSLPDAAESTAMPTSQSSPIMIKQEGDGEDLGLPGMSNPDDGMDANEVKEETPAPSSMESVPNQITRIAQHATNQDDGDISMDEIEETDFEDNRHDTASVELGDDLSISGSVPPHSTAPLGGEHYSEDEGEDNWFVSLRRMRPTGPVWSDDRHTPFKRFAEAEMNVLSERLRRGGSKVLLDEKGVIRRLIHR